jgi:hypothetical protein
MPAGHNPGMTSTDSDDWSPADHPYAIAISEAQWWQQAAQLAVLRMRDDDQRIAFSPHQVDARQLVFALSQLLRAERLEQVALTTLAMDPSLSGGTRGGQKEPVCCAKATGAVTDTGRVFPILARRRGDLVRVSYAHLAR